jgi:hypothetical protein
MQSHTNQFQCRDLDPRNKPKTTRYGARPVHKINIIKYSTLIFGLPEVLWKNFISDKFKKTLLL